MTPRESSRNGPKKCRKIRRNKRRPSKGCDAGKIFRPLPPKRKPRCSVMHRGLFHQKAGILGCSRIPGLSKKAFSDCMAAFRAAGQKEIVFGAALEKQRRLRGCPAVFQRAMPFLVSRDPVGSEGSRDFYHAASLIQGGGDQRFKTVTGRAGPFHTFSSRHG